MSTPTDPAASPADGAARPALDSRIGLGERFGYGVGDLASNLTWTTITTYLLVFYTNVALIGAAAAGLLLLLARILDALIDPAVGVIVDRTRTRLGRARPFIIFGAPLLAVLTVLTFMTPGTHGPADLVWAFATFILVGILYSLVNIPYGALLPMMTRDSKLRLTLSGFRFASAAVGLLIVSVATTPLVTALGAGDARRGWLLTVIIYSAVGLVGFWIVGFTVKERISAPPVQRTRGSLRVALKTLVTNGPWVAVFFAALLLFVRLAILTSGTVYYALIVMKNPAAISIVLLGFSISAFVGSVLTPIVLRRTGSRRGIIIGLIISCVLTLLLPLFNGNVLVFTVIFFISGIVGGFGFAAIPALVSDTVEYQQHKSGQRDEGLLYAGYSFATKVGTALGGAFLAWGLAIIGYNPTAAPTQAISSSYTVLYVGLTIAAALLQALALAFYRLEGRLPEINAANAERAADVLAEPGI